MRIDEYPNLLVLAKLLDPIEISLGNLRESKEHISSNMPKTLLRGSFVMSVASMEVMLADVLKRFLIRFPQKLPDLEFKFNKPEFFGDYFNLLTKSVENHINSLSYRSFDEFFKKLLDHLSIEWHAFQESFGADLKEIKATRNLLLHNNLIINDQYIESAGEKIRANSRGSELKIDFDYACYSIDKLIIFEETLKRHLEVKYRDYTKINANKTLWEFMFKSPRMKYDDYWQYDEEKDKIFALKKPKHEGSLSGSEAMLLGIWRSHFNQSDDHLRAFNMRSLDNRNQEKILFFLSIAGDFSFY